MTPRPPSPDAAARLRQVFADAGYDGATIARRLRATGEPIYSHRDLVVHRRRLAVDPDALAALLTLLVLGDPLPAAEAERLLGDGAALLVEHRLAEERGGALHGLARVVPHDDLLIASDRLDVETADRVAGVHRPSATLSHLTIRRPVERALDVGTGNGIQALLLSRHAERVVATDVNERALAFAEFNLALNGADNVELRSGSLLQPVAGERFACVVSNPPYVISPDSLYVYRDSGLPGDSVSAELARGLPDVLEPGGFATLMASWVQTGDDPAARPREWLDDRCDAWILHTTTDDALTNAAVWNRDAIDDLDELGATIDRWTSYYRDEGIETLAYGALVLRRRGGGGSEAWSRAAGLPAKPLERASTHLLRLFAGVDAAEAGVEALLDLRLAPAPAVRFEQVVSPHDGWTVTSAVVELREGLGFRADVDEPTLRLLRALDGSLTAREAVVASLGAEALEAAPAILRRMVETGFLEVV
jgi:methylase of polypeptide subunit release factors